MGRREIFTDIDLERDRQNDAWGEQHYPWSEWLAVLGEEYGEVCQEVADLTFRRNDDPARLRTELIQLAAVAVQIVEHIDSEGATH